LTINPLFENTWFMAGCAALRVEDWVEAERAYRRVVAIDHENSEAWSNQAAVLTHLGRPKEAYHALKQATRNNRENWRIWQNFMYVCMDVGEYQEAMQAIQRIVELRADKVGVESVDLSLLDQLMRAIMHYVDIPVSETNPEEAEAERAMNARLLQRFEYLLREVITSRITNSSRLWQTCARFYMWRKDYESCLDAHVKAYRALLHSSACDASTKEFEEVAELAIETADMYRNLGPRTVKSTGINNNNNSNNDDSERLVAKDWQFQARALLRSLIGRTRDTFGGTPMHDQLVEALEDLKQAP
jgi:tetratricopeptide (TPR) repeat protein